MNPTRPFARSKTYLSPEEAEIAARAVEGGLVSPAEWLAEHDKGPQILAQRLSGILGREVRFPYSGWNQIWEPVRLAVCRVVWDR